MLSSEFRLHRAADFRAVVRRGRRASRPLLTVHALLADQCNPGQPAALVLSPRAGLVVSKAVGGSVQRHRTSRRLRHLLRDRLTTLPAGVRVVVRAAPAAGAAPSAALGADLDAALRSALRPRGPR
ncbi:MAG: ribonuclease P protein component [Mycobacteriales bacterium]